MTETPDTSTLSDSSRESRLAGWRLIVARVVAYSFVAVTVLVYALYYLLALLLPIFLMRHGPTLVTESLWGLAWTPIGAALVSQGSRTHAAIPATVPVP